MPKYVQKAYTLKLTALADLNDGVTTSSVKDYFVPSKVKQIFQEIFENELHDNENNTPIVTKITGANVSVTKKSLKVVFKCNVQSSLSKNDLTSILGDTIGTRYDILPIVIYSYVEIEHVNVVALGNNAELKAKEAKRNAALKAKEAKRNAALKAKKSACMQKCTRLS
jgi:hypothetical protein